MKQKIIDFVKKHSYLNYDGEYNKQLLFATRKYGDVLEEEPSGTDLREAIDAAKQLNKTFGNHIATDVNTVDEWVELTVTINKYD